MTFELSHRSMVNLQGVHPDLCKVVVRALELSPLDFAIIQGLRTEEEEEQDVAKGLSQTRDSRHLFGLAVDFMALVDGKPCWIDDVRCEAGPELHPYHQIAAAFQQAADEFHIPIVWGGVWISLHDLDHIELDRKAYPDPVTS